MHFLTLKASHVRKNEWLSNKLLQLLPLGELFQLAPQLTLLYFYFLRYGSKTGTSFDTCDFDLEGFFDFQIFWRKKKTIGPGFSHIDIYIIWTFVEHKEHEIGLERDARRR